ncbi:uncharacterized protein LOC126981882 isoform X3 [Eriocheir sinensis]|uniref:uncharacterized protein LOC126981882 isoform X3 n=1 Tax=Eriocheir sinensis TaxID=95602 RepID=UPI0021C5EA07|nr:uncharacterized protein LOC126981882 isoform X3 [Eriocheir sinensis]
MAHSPEDIRNNNVLVEQEQRVSAGVAVPGIAEATVTQGTPVGSLTGASVLAQLMARTLDNQAEDAGPPSLGSITLHDEYLEDPLPDLTLENLRLPDEYGDPSLGYEFVHNQALDGPGLDNAQALLYQLQGLGVRVNEDYLTLDLDLSASRSASLTSVSDEGSVADEHELHGAWLSTALSRARKAPLAMAPKDATAALFPRVSGTQEDDVFLDCHEHEVAEAEILPSGGVKVTYENYRKEYRPKISPHHNYVRFLETVPSGAASEEPLSLGQEAAGAAAPPAPHLTLEDRYRRVLQALQRGARLSDEKMRSLSAKYARKLRRLLAEEVTYDAVTPDSGVHESFNALSPEEQEKLREEWKAELAKTEEEIQTLRQVLGAKVKTAQDLKRRLGITVWREFTEDFNNSMKTVRESQPSQYVQNLPVVQKANEVITEIQEAVSSAPLYQKTAGAMSAVGEKTSSLFGGIGAKFGQLKETPTFKSFEERVGGVYSAARTRMGGSGSNSTQDFEEALKEAEGEKAALEAANGGALQTSTTPGTDVTQPAAS